MPERAAPQAASSRIPARIGAMYRATNAGVICEASQATISVPAMSAISDHITVPSRLRR